MKINNKCEAFDVAIALYNWCAHNHEGQFSDKYKALSIASDYNMTNIPEIDENTKGDAYEEAVFIYSALDELNWSNYYDAFIHFMENDWDNED